MQAAAIGISEIRSGLLERSAHLSQLGDALGAVAVAESSRGRLVLLGGEAGIGKTAVLRVFCDEQRDTARILWGACDPLFTPRPLGPFLDIARATQGELQTRVESGARPHEVLATLMDELHTRTPTILVLEDVHWADEATLDVLRLLARRVESAPALVIASYRDDELERGHPLRIVLGEVATGRAIGRLEVAALSKAAVEELARPHSVNVDELHRKTAGNPFFVTEVLAAGEEEVPHTIRDAVLARAARLSPAAMTLLETVAVVPPQAELWLLDALAGEASDHLEECLTSGMLRHEQAGVAFRHELARLAVEESLAPNRRVALHRKTVAALADPPTGTPDLARLAHHAETAGDAEAVRRFAPAAAARASSLGAHREAAAQYARVLRFAHGVPAETLAQLLEQRAYECYVIDDYDQAIEALEHALDLHRVLGDRLGEGNALCSLSTFLWCPGARCRRWCGSSLRRGRQMVASIMVARRSNSRPAYPLSPTTITGPCRWQRLSRARQTSRSGVFGEVSASARRVPSRANRPCSRKPQK